MSDQGSASQIWNIIGKLLPVATFFLGYLLKRWEETHKRKRELGNIRAVLCKELSQNYWEINRLTPIQGGRRPNPYVLAHVLSSLSFSVYDKYLDRISELKRIEIDRLYDAYLRIKEAAKESSEFLEIYKQREYGIFDAPDIPATRTLFGRSDAVLYLISEALRIIKNGRRGLAAMEKGRGSGIEQMEEYLRWLHDPEA